jgi:SM-20-related protein
MHKGFSPNSIEAMLSDIETQHWAICSDFLSPDQAIALAAELRHIYQQGEFQRAGIGTGANYERKAEIRGDLVYWLEEDRLSSLQACFWQQIQTLKDALNRTFFLGLQDFEAHFALYPQGSFYKKHLDQHQAVQERLISCILYLNPNWKKGDGGELRIYLADDAYIDVEPTLATFVCFRSDTVWHEVLPTNVPRAALTGWLRRRNSHF